MSRNRDEDRRELDDIVYYDRGLREVEGTLYRRLAIQTHFVQRGESYLKIMERYVVPLAKPGDILAFGEKVISMCQDNTVEMKDVKVGFWARFLSKFATSNNHGIGMDEPYKLQLAINLKGLPLILWACLCGGIARIFGKRGVFYEIVGQDIAGIDGFYKDSSFEIYHTLAILNPREPDGVCAEIESEYALSGMIVDANDLNVEVIGKAPSLADRSDSFLAELIRDNPAGQGAELTPFVIIRAEPEAE